jgi:hypothetical protein
VPRGGWAAPAMLPFLNQRKPDSKIMVKIPRLTCVHKKSEFSIQYLLKSYLFDVNAAYYKKLKIVGRVNEPLLKQATPLWIIYIGDVC